ncbi:MULTISPECIES: cation diffusion facilitator family transporter [Alphaproteobacteria]|jgi:cobalt-zinc-cadmium efflux system protein|uniref:Cobalt-zinc-cadmium efflux system protein n=1 Tax=Albimonas pacifica TaxID=1114924 RepID=A0A1I3QKS2_9RHOB|nr:MULTISPECIES: cation diffusion facilitator family transporter [Alphaproteobacteria]MAY85151.1 cation transporter [Pseudooceanicola sp.]MBR27402.1 cation transporter [Paracoccaceae bacterium]MBR29644.1 cation transporter [Paracoccaceae bacterium]MCO6389235.1 cation diffusion facilitator family transporter [Aliihoeflea sp. 40Bstr573]OWU69924.1 cation diffusion facilitator family transporter [Phaeobacter sp. 22II1-1F12B]|tara:strand:- start:350 stop:1285 length:936 start_codon:yes stop_codon:yes gene_type:complete
MGHGHHHHVDLEAGDRRVFAAIAVNMGLTVAQIVGGIVSGSLALIADALHNFSDAISLIIAFGARKIARRPRDAEMTFGYGRVEVVAALINYTTLIVIGLYLLYEAAMRFADPQPVEGWLIVIIAGIALIVDAVTAALTYAMSKSSVNIRAAFLHNVADALGSVAVIVAGTLILLYDWRLIDPLVTVLIAGYILWQSFREIGPVIRILMLGSPPEIETDAVLDTVRGIDGVMGIHHAHFWQMDEHRAALDAHVVIAEGRWSDADAVKERIKAALADRFDIEHTTLELECARHACDDPSEFGGQGHGDERHG